MSSDNKSPLGNTDSNTNVVLTSEIEGSDENLMLSYAKGDEESFKKLYFRHQAPLYRYCVRQFRNPALAEECYQEVWIKLIKSRKRYHPKAKFTTFFYRIAQNHIIDTYRKEKKRDADCEYDEQAGMRLNEISEKQPLSIERLESRANHDKIAELRIAISKLPFEQRNTLLLKIDSGLSIEQIAEVTESKKESVKSRLRYATSKLKHLLGSKVFAEHE